MKGDGARFLIGFLIGLLVWGALFSWLGLWG